MIVCTNIFIPAGQIHGGQLNVTGAAVHAALKEWLHDRIPGIREIRCEWSTKRLGWVAAVDYDDSVPRTNTLSPDIGDVALEELDRVG